jgi:hypothetical protein
MATDAFIASVDPALAAFPEAALAASCNTVGLLGPLRAHANRHRVAREWLYGDRR